MMADDPAKVDQPRGARPMRSVRGIVPSLNTPFDGAGEVDLKSLGRLIDHLVQAGAVGCLANAVAGEVDSLTADERHRMLGVVLGEADGRLMVIVGVSDRTIDGSVERAGDACRAGATAINWRAPPGLRGRPLYDAVRLVAGAGPDVFVLQDLDFQGPGLPLDEILELAEREPRLVSVKVESALPGPKISRLLEAAGGRLHVMGGWPTTSMLDSLERGAHAFMPSHMIPTLVRLARLQQSGRTDLAALLFERVMPLFAFVAQHFDVSLRVGKMLRVAEGVFATEQVRSAMPFDRRMEDQARVLVARSLAIADEIEALAG
jgi:dihydrodipicolinate synthase/N-acetylneuraminate lyase